MPNCTGRYDHCWLLFVYKMIWTFLLLGSRTGCKHWETKCTLFFLRIRQFAELTYSLNSVGLRKEYSSIEYLSPFFSLLKNQFLCLVLWIKRTRIEVGAALLVASVWRSRNVNRRGPGVDVRLKFPFFFSFHWDSGGGEVMGRWWILFQ